MKRLVRTRFNLQHDPILWIHHSHMCKDIFLHHGAFIGREKCLHHLCLEMQVKRSSLLKEMHKIWSSQTTISTYIQLPLGCAMWQMRDLALREAHCVLKPGGRYLCLEFSKLPSPIFQRVYDITPVLGELVTNYWASYQYLVESIRKFSDQEEVK